MMLIICDKLPQKNFEYLVENTNKNYIFKSLLELAQLVCSCGYSEVYKPIKQGKEIQEWIKKNKLWAYRFYTCLWFWCAGHIKMKPKTLCDLYFIRNYLFDNIKHKKRITYPKTAIWRYSKEYDSEYPTNSELPIEVVCELYKKYLLEFKGFGKKEVKW